MSNYNSTSVGVPYVRAPRIDIHYPPPGSGDSPWARIEQAEAVKLADGSSRHLRDLTALEPVFNLASQTVMPLVDPDTGAPLSQATRDAIAAGISAGGVTLQGVMLILLAVVRAEQNAAGV